ETAEALWALIGLGTPHLRDRMPGVDDRALLARAGLLARQPRSEAGLAGLLADHFGVPVAVEPLVGRWLAMPEDEWTRIGRGGAHRSLGTDAVLGRRVWDPQAAVRIRLGPLPLDVYESLLPAGRTAAGPPEGAALAQLRELVRFYAGVETSFVLTLVLDADQAPPMRLPRAGSANAPRLGWTSWLAADGDPPVPPPVLDGNALRVSLFRDPQIPIDPERGCGCAAAGAPRP
ncbi:MAG TPA: type VI secretion system baseplate subunit TssG, partial [Longimicrobium sp.]|nr:type VI secretion system baseplate subunit TssG [Longimicrobium sp.]